MRAALTVAEAVLAEAKVAPRPVLPESLTVPLKMQEEEEEGKVGLLLFEVKGGEYDEEE